VYAMTPTVEPVATDAARGATAISIPFDTIREPGTYVCNWNGFLLRVPVGMPGPGQGRALNLVGSEPLLVTKISDDPQLPVVQARALATALSLKISF